MVRPYPFFSKYSLEHGQCELHLTSAELLIDTCILKDIIPKYGLALHKPSPLWPPPPDEITTRVQARLRSHIKDIFRHDSRSEKRNSSRLNVNNVFCSSIWRRSRSADTHRERRTASSSATDIALSRRSSDVRASAISHLDDGHVDLQLGQEGPLPTAVDPNASQTISLRASDGEELVVHDQVQLYCSNNLVVHPLVSPALSYLGGLPELLVIASDAEVLRDEILFRFVTISSCCIHVVAQMLRQSISAHKAAHPDRYEVKPEAREMYPPLQGIEARHKPTKVHLQVYDGTGHHNFKYEVLLISCRGGARLTGFVLVHNARQILLPSDGAVL